MKTKYAMCGGCKFWCSIDGSIEGIGTPQYGECRRYPPMIVSASIKQQILHEGASSDTIASDDWDDILAATHRPITYYEDWCGEFSEISQRPDQGTTK